MIIQAEALNKAMTTKVAGLIGDVAALNDALSTEKMERTTADETLNTKLLSQCEKVRDALTRELLQRSDEQQQQHKAVESTLQNVFMNLQQEKQMREDELSALQQGLYDEASVRHTENTALSEVVDRVADRVRGGMHVQDLPLAAELSKTQDGQLHSQSSTQSPVACDASRF